MNQGNLFDEGQDVAEPFETLREVGVAFEGFRDEVRGQFSMLKWIIGGAVALAAAVSGFTIHKLDNLEDTVARNSAILERIEARLNEVAADTGAIREAVQSASATPEPGTFDGWIGVNAESEAGKRVLDAVDEGAGPKWIYVPAEN